jgi:uncharacterized protein YndB with AHSA1/START domain
VKDILDELTATDRTVSRRDADGTEVLGVLLRRRYDAAVDDVWDAVTDPERLRRWMLPVTGDLRPGGTYALEGNAAGEILRCEPPSTLTVTWNGPASIVQVRLTPEGTDRTLLELEHTVPVEFVGSGAGALYVGPGWDLTVLGLGRFLRGVVAEDPSAWENSPEGQRFAERSIDAWVEAVTASGTASADEVATATEASRAQFAPDLVAGPEAATD